MSNDPKILVFDIETAPITAYTWGLFDQNIGLNQIKKDWHLLAWAAKWYGDPASKTMYMDNSTSRLIQDDRELIKGLSKLLNEADIIITQNGEKFDVRKLNARAAIHGLPPIKPCKSTDLLKESRKIFAFTSHKLEYMAEVLNTKYKKLKHKEYPGFELWSAILAGDKRAWKVMKTYCIHDVLSTEELYGKLYGWIRTQNMATYMDGAVMRCKCGSDKLTKEGYARTEAGKYQIYHCQKCGKWPRGGKNLLTFEKRQNLLRDWRTNG
jgi:DNA polymerase elongation subunit (family B)